MDFSIKRLDEEYESSYTNFILNKKESLMYYSIKYRNFISDLLEDHFEYLIAVDADNEVIGCMPIFYRDNPNTGIVANSLPYYGGHGGVLANDDNVRRALLEEYISTIKSRKCVASTIVGSPLEDLDLLYKDIIKQDFIDERIELMTYFPYVDGVSYAESLMNIYHYKERWSIRKAMKNDVKVEVDNSAKAFDFLFNVHTENMSAIGGQPKIRKSFDLITSHFIAGEDYDVYIAKIDNKEIAALLVFYFNGTVEYYTPVIVEQYRTIQPLTLIIYIAMQDAMKKGYEKWNWGGTSLTQKSLLDFKSKWGTTETRYFYYTKIWNEGILRLNREELMKIYSNYYVYPFNQLDMD